MSNIPGIRSEAEIRGHLAAGKKILIPTTKKHLSPSERELMYQHLLQILRRIEKGSGDPKLRERAAEEFKELRRQLKAARSFS